MRAVRRGVSGSQSETLLCFFHLDTPILKLAPQQGRPKPLLHEWVPRNRCGGQDLCAPLHLISLIGDEICQCGNILLRHVRLVHHITEGHEKTQLAVIREVVKTPDLFDKLSPPAPLVEECGPETIHGRMRFHGVVSNIFD